MTIVVGGTDKTRKKPLDPKRTVTYYSKIGNLVIQMEKRKENILDGRVIIDRGRTIKWRDSVLKTDDKKVIDFIDNKILAGSYGHVWCQLVRKAPSSEAVEKAREVAENIRRYHQGVIKEAKAEDQVDEVKKFDEFLQSKMKKKPAVVRGMREAVL